MAIIQAINQTNKRGLRHLHIDGGESTVGDGAADGTGEGKTGVELEAAVLGRRGGGGRGSGLLSDGRGAGSGSGRRHD